MADDVELRRLIPFLYGQSVRNGQPMARGRIVQVTVASANADVALTHSLGRVPAIMPILLDSGTTYTPKMKRGVTAWTNTNVYLQFDTTGTYTLWVV